MRIGAGAFRGRTLRTPKGEATRPTSGMVRETLFNILAPDIPDACFLDLFAGCGSVGLEALSRGAAHAVFVEKARQALACLQGNIETLGVRERCTVLPYSVDRAMEHLSHSGERFEIIFLDPPFADTAAYQSVFDSVSDHQLLRDDGILVAQHDARVHLPDETGSLKRYRIKQIGDNALSFYQLAG